MPSWKKVIISGSDASLSSLIVTNNVSASIYYGDGSQLTGITTTLPSGIVSSSSQLTSSYDLRYALSGSSIDLSNIVATGSFSGSFVGDGSGLTNISFDIGDEASFSQPFTDQTTFTVTHALNSQYPFVQVYESGSNEQIIPLTVKVLDSSSVQISFTENVSGYVVVAKGGHIVQGTSENANLLNGEAGSFYLDYTNFTNIPQGLVSSSSQLTSSYDIRYILSGSITAADWNTLLNRPAGIVSSSTQIIPLLPTGTVSGSSQVVGILSSLNSYTSSNDTTNTTQNNRLDQLSTASGSAIGRLNNIETFSGSVNTKFSTLATYTGSNDTTNTTQNTRLDLLSTESGSIRSTFNSYTSSNDTTNTTQNNRLDLLSTFSGSAISRLGSLENETSSYARTDINNTFSGLQSFTDINVNGTASFAYIQAVTGSSTNIGEAFIILNENTPASNFAGIKVVDSGSSFSTSSFLYDGLNNNWIFQHTGSPRSGSSLAIFGPLSQDGLGTEVGLTENRIPKAVTIHGHHISDSNITDTGTLITLGSNTVINGTVVASGTTIISGSSQVSYTGLSNIPLGIVSGAAQIVPLLPTGTVSGSSQVVGILSSLNSYTASNDTTNTTQNNRLTSLETASGSAIGRLNNIESFTSSINTTIKTQLDVNTVVSSSSQLTSSYDLRYALSGSVGGGGGSGEFYTTTNTPFRSGSNTDVDSGTEAVITVSTSSFSSAFFDYVIFSGSNSRAGTVVSVWNGNTIEFAETSTKSIGTTTDVNLSVTLSSGDVVLNATTTTNDWTVKALARML